MLNAIIIMLVQVTPIAVEAISWRYFLIFIFMDAIYIVVFYFMFPETANVPLEASLPTVVGSSADENRKFASCLVMR